jgi:hypothetical protein
MMTPLAESTPQTQWSRRQPTAGSGVVREVRVRQSLVVNEQERGRYKTVGVTPFPDSSSGTANNCDNRAVNVGVTQSLQPERTPELAAVFLAPTLAYRASVEKPLYVNSSVNNSLQSTRPESPFTAVNNSPPLAPFPTP